MKRKHVIKISNYPENEAFIYCPQKNLFSLIKIVFPLTCPSCGKTFKTKYDVKFVLRQNLEDFRF
mgnify:CR=1 FL=1|jgi:hypothetical protein